MLFTVTTTHSPATDLGYLLGKNPARTHSFDLPFGRAHVFWPEADPDRSTAALLVDVDSVGLVRGRTSPDDAPLAHYVNDRPYAASSFLSVALARVFHSALNGRSRDRQELADTPIPLQATLHAVPCRGGAEILLPVGAGVLPKRRSTGMGLGIVRRLFEPLGYTVHVEQLPLDPARPDWGPSRLHDVTLAATCRLADLLSHVYVLVPVLDDQKHYWVGQDEVDKLLARGEGWLEAHPARDLIVERYLKHRRPLVRNALERLQEDAPDAEDPTQDAPDGEEGLERPLSLKEQRLQAVHDVLIAEDVKTVADLGCGEGKLLARLLRDKRFTRVLGMDVSVRSLERARQRFDPDRLPERVVERLVLLHGSVTYRDARLNDLDAACLVEVIEHLDEDRLPAIEAAIFGAARPRVVVVTTPNAEYNALFTNLPPGRFRHADHRFEWTREQFTAWATAVADRHGYAVRFLPIGPEDPTLGAPTQMGVFSR